MIALPAGSLASTGQALHVPAVVAAAVTLLAACATRRRRPALALVAVVIVAGTAFNALAAVQPRSNVRFLPLAFLGAAMALVTPAPGRRAGT